MPEPTQAQESQLVVAIDGPSGSGKSSVAKELAARLGFRYLDTGAMYRAVTWYFLAADAVDQADEAAVQRLLDGLTLRLPGPDCVEVNGHDVTAHLRSREVESRVSAVSAMPAVRRAMRRLQRDLATAGPLVAEGRDMASVVYPQARWKFYLDAAPRERARRRHRDFLARGREVTEAEVLEEINVRDHLDSTRRDAPLMRADGAELVDTTGVTQAAVVEALWRRVDADRRR
jgi:cytidylate kinase